MGQTSSWITMTVVYTFGLSRKFDNETIDHAFHLDNLSRSFASSPLRPSRLSVFSSCKWIAYSRILNSADKLPCTVVHHSYRADLTQIIGDRSADSARIELFKVSNIKLLKLNGSNPDILSSKSELPSGFNLADLTTQKLLEIKFKEWNQIAGPTSRIAVDHLRWLMRLNLTRLTRLFTWWSSFLAGSFLRFKLWSCQMRKFNSLVSIHRESSNVLPYSVWTRDLVDEAAHSQWLDSND